MDTQFTWSAVKCTLSVERMCWYILLWVAYLVLNIRRLESGYIHIVHVICVRFTTILTLPVRVKYVNISGVFYRWSMIAFHLKLTRVLISYTISCWDFSLKTMEGILNIMKSFHRFTISPFHRSKRCETVKAWNGEKSLF